MTKSGLLVLERDMTHNGEVRGASRLAGEASTSTVVLGTDTKGEQ